MEARVGVAGYLVIVDAQGNEMPRTRTDIAGMTEEQIRGREFRMAMSMPDGCRVAFTEGPMPPVTRDS